MGRAEQYTGEYQAGFKKDHSTVDHMFTILAAIQKQSANNRKLYVALIDFEKAFDSISRKLMWPILLKKWNSRKAIPLCIMMLKPKLYVGRN